MRYFVTFSYDGSRYHGWQIQPNGDSVQAQLQRALSLLLRSEIIVTGAGRTDAGVHARMMVAHFDFDAEIDGRQLTYKLNKLLPYDIAVSGVEQVADDLHARFREDLGIAEAGTGSAAGNECDLASKVFHDIAPYLRDFQMI